MEVDKDAVSAMQESVDQLALSMFDSLRLIPFSEEVKGGARGSLADGVLKQARALDGLIDVLPGAELREDQQME
ncbi:unnamed protein product, partial [Ectocarpus fasciculatus]